MKLCVLGTTIAHDSSIKEPILGQAIGFAEVTMKAYDTLLMFEKSVIFFFLVFLYLKELT